MFSCSCSSWESPDAEAPYLHACSLPQCNYNFKRFPLQTGASAQPQSGFGAFFHVQTKAAITATTTPLLRRAAQPGAKNHPRPGDRRRGRLIRQMKRKTEGVRKQASGRESQRGREQKESSRVRCCLLFLQGPFISGPRGVAAMSRMTMPASAHHHRHRLRSSPLLCSARTPHVSEDTQGENNSHTQGQQGATH